jgi:hypothetical protein
MAEKISFTFDPFELIGLPVPEDGGDEARRRMARFVRDQVIEYCGDGKSPVAGGAWKRTLSAAYKKRKIEQGGNAYADMILEGDMLKALDCVVLDDGMLELVIEGPEAAKADGHNNHSGKSTLPMRQFIPEEDGSFKPAILSGMRAIAREFFE